MAATSKDTSFYGSFVVGEKEHQGNSFFNVKLVKGIDFRRRYEVALASATIPSYIQNISENTYCTLHRMRKTSSDTLVSQDPMLSKIMMEHEGVSYVLDYAIRLKIPAGFYSSFEELKNVLKHRAYEVSSNGAYEIIPYDKMLHEMGSGISASQYYKDILRVKNNNMGEFYMGSRYIETQFGDIPDLTLVDTLNNIMFFDRLTHETILDRVDIAPDFSFNSRNYIMRMDMTQSLKTFLGFRDDSIYIKPDATMQSQQRMRIYPYRHLFLSSDIVDPLYIVNGVKTRALREIPIKNIPRLGGLIHHEFQVLRYIPMNKNSLDQIGFGLWSEDSKEGGLESTFFKDSQYNIVFTLHFRPIE